MTGCVDEGALEFMWVSCGGTSDKRSWEPLLNITGPDLQLLCPELRYKMSLCVLYDHPGVGSVWGRRGDNHGLCWACRHSSYPHRQRCYRCLAGEIHSSSYISLCKVYIHMSDIFSFHKVSPWLQRLMMPNKTMQSKYFILSTNCCRINGFTFSVLYLCALSKVTSCANICTSKQHIATGWGCQHRRKWSGRQVKT